MSVPPIKAWLYEDHKLVVNEREDEEPKQLNATYSASIGDQNEP